MRIGKKIFVRVSYIRRSICMFWHTVQSASFKKFRHLVFESTKPIDQRSSKMKFIALAVALFCAVAYVTAEVQQEELLETYNPVRFRREANPQGSVVISGQKPLSGPDRRPSLDIDYHQRVYDRNGVNANAYGGVNIRPGQPAQPHIGLQAERNFKNGFIGGFGQVQRGPGGRPSPTFGLNGGFRFRRDVDEVIEQGEEQ